MTDADLHPADLPAALSQATAAAFERQGLAPAEAARFGAVRLSDRPDLADFQCNGALAAAKSLKRKPREIAEAVVADLSEQVPQATLSIAGPGFINFKMADGALGEALEALMADQALGIRQAAGAPKVFLDYGGPNVAKPMHVGHLRSSIIGETVKRILRLYGHEVVGDIHLGDWGTQMGMLIREVERAHPGLPYFDPDHKGPFPEESPVSLADLEEMYPRASALAKEDPEELKAASAATADLQAGRAGYRALWQHFVDVSRQAIERDLGLLDVSFEQWFGESRYQERIPGLIEQLLETGYATLREGAAMVDFPEGEGKKELPPMVVRKSDGGFLYASTDLATIDERVNEMGAQLLLYVVDMRQSLHFEQVFRMAQESGIAAQARFEHIGFGTMNGQDGKPFKTRAGGVMKLNDLITLLIEEARKRIAEREIDQETYTEEELAEMAFKIGVAALKFADLSHERSQNYIFDVEKFTRFEGKTGPYLLYTAVRIKSLFAKLAASEGANLAPGPVVIREPAERELVFHLLQLPRAMGEAYAKRMPHFLCDYAHVLAQTFNTFYQKCPVLSEPEEAVKRSRLMLATATLKQLEFMFSVLGLSAPERM